MTAVEVNMPPMYAKQREAVYAPERVSCIEASTKSGKTVGCLVWQAERVLRETRYPNHWWVAPVYPQADIAYRRARQMFRGLCTAQDQARRLTFANGCVWWFKSGEVPDNLYGEDVGSVVIDEASRLREESWYAVRSTITATRAPVRMIGNVKGRGNWFYRACRRAQQGEPDYSYHVITAQDAVDAGVLDPDEIESARRDLPEQVFRELYFCEPADDGGNPFGLQHVAACVGPLSNQDPVAFGVDLAKSVDWTVVYGLDRDGCVCVFDRWQRVPWDETERRLIAAIGDTPAMVDSTGVGDPIVERLQRACPLVEGYKFTSQSKQQLMEGLASAIQSNAIRYPAGVTTAELEVFEYEYHRTGVRYSAPEGLHDDCVCALALAVQKWQQMQHGPRVAVLGGAVEQVGPRMLDGETMHDYYERMRQDPEWGF